MDLFKTFPMIAPRAALLFVTCLTTLPACDRHPPETSTMSNGQQSGAYGFEAPRSAPELFAFDLLGSNDGQICLAMSPGGDELYYTNVTIGEKGVSFSLNSSSRIDGEWSPPQPVSFASNHGDLEAFFDISGKRLYYFSTRPTQDTKVPDRTPNLWYVDREGQAWGQPVLIGRPDPFVKFAWSTSLLDDHTLYFTARPHGNPGLADIYQATIVNDALGEPSPVEGAVNTVDYTENEPAISPDGRYMVFYSAGREDAMAEGVLGDLYISFRDEEGRWGPATRLDSPINSTAEENWPRFSPDGKFLFFSSNRREGANLPDLYWVSTDAFEKYRQ
jgi:Tol biopolymer transport system component